MITALFSFVFLIGALQGLFLVIYLFFPSDDKRQAKYFLGFLILILAYDLFETALSIQNTRLTSTAILGFSHVLTIGPSMFLLIKASIDSKRLSRRRIALYYLPAIIDFPLSVGIFALRYKLFFGDALAPETYLALNFAHLISTRLLAVVVFWIYFGYSVREFRKFDTHFTRDNLYITGGEVETIKRWLNTFLHIAAVLGVVWTVTIFGVVIFERQNIIYLYYPIELLMVFATCWIGFSGYHRIKLAYLEEQKNTEQHFNKLQFEDISCVITSLTETMKTDRPFLDSELTIEDLAAEIGYPPRTVLAILRRHMKVGFGEYVNRHRIEEALELMRSSRKQNSPIDEIAFDCGFQTEKAFRKAFRNVTGLSVEKYLKRQIEQTPVLDFWRA